MTDTRTKDQRDLDAELHEGFDALAASRTSKPSKEQQLGCDYQGYEFGARYPDSVCIEGRLLDADNCDDNGNLYDNDENIPCPMCQREEAIKWHASQFSKGTYRERMKSARLLVADIINNRKTGRFPL